jgi:hypothetical protein
MPSWDVDVVDERAWRYLRRSDPPDDITKRKKECPLLAKR